MHFSNLKPSDWIAIMLGIFAIIIVTYLWKRWEKRHQVSKTWRECVCTTHTPFTLAPLRNLPDHLIKTDHDYYALDTGNSYYVILNSPDQKERVELLPKSFTTLNYSSETPSCKIVENALQLVEIDHLGEEHRSAIPKEVRYYLNVPAGSVCIDDSTES